MAPVRTGGRTLSTFALLLSEDFWGFSSLFGRLWGSFLALELFKNWALRVHVVLPQWSGESWCEGRGGAAPC